MPVPRSLNREELVHFEFIPLAFAVQVSERWVLSEILFCKWSKTKVCFFENAFDFLSFFLERSFCMRIPIKRGARNFYLVSSVCLSVCLCHWNFYSLVIKKRRLLSLFLDPVILSLWSNCWFRSYTAFAFDYCIGKGHLVLPPLPERKNAIFFYQLCRLHKSMPKIGWNFLIVCL